MGITLLPRKRVDNCDWEPVPGGLHRRCETPSGMAVGEGKVLGRRYHNDGRGGAQAP